MAMAGGFLAISPKLRDSLFDGYAQAGTMMEINAPYSYVGLGLAVAGLLVIFLYKAGQPR